MARVLPLNSRSLREKVSAEEWARRVDLAACYRLVALYGMTDLVYNHITARVPGADDHVLINPYGMLYDEITASSLIKIDLEGNTVLQPDHDYSVNAAGYVIHSAVHGARHDAECVIHTHTRAGTAVSALAEGLMPLVADGHALCRPCRLSRLRGTGVQPGRARAARLPTSATRMR